MDKPELDALGEPVAPSQQGLARFATGAVRGTDADGERWDLITPIGLRRLAETCAEGARKYGEANWQKGIPASVMLGPRHSAHLLVSGRRHERRPPGPCRLELFHVGSQRAAVAHRSCVERNFLAAFAANEGVCHFEEAMSEMIDIPARKPSPGERWQKETR